MWCSGGEKMTGVSVWDDGWVCVRVFFGGGARLGSDEKSVRRGVFRKKTQWGFSGIDSAK